MNKLLTLQLLHRRPTPPRPPSPLCSLLAVLHDSHTALTPETRLITIARVLITGTIVRRSRHEATRGAHIATEGATRKTIVSQISAIRSTYARRFAN